MSGISKNQSCESVRDANEAIELLKMSRRIYEAKVKGLIDENSAIEAIIKINKEAVAEIEESLRLQRAAIRK